MVGILIDSMYERRPACPIFENDFKISRNQNYQRKKNVEMQSSQ